MLQIKIHGIPPSYYPHISKIVEFQTPNDVFQSSIVSSNSWNEEMSIPVVVNDDRQLEFSSILVRILQVRKSYFTKKREELICEASLDISEFIENVSHVRVITLNTVKERKPIERSTKLVLTVTPKNFGMNIEKRCPLHYLFSEDYQYHPILRIVCSFLSAKTIVKTISILSKHVLEVTRSVPMNYVSHDLIPVDEISFPRLLSQRRFTGIRLLLDDSFEPKMEYFQSVDPMYLRILHLHTSNKRNSCPIIIFSVGTILRHFHNLEHLLIEEQTETRISSSLLKKRSIIMSDVDDDEEEDVIITEKTIPSTNLKSFRYFNNGTKVTEVFISHVVELVDLLIRKIPSLYFVHMNALFKFLPKTVEYLVDRCDRYFGTPSPFVEVLIRDFPRERILPSGQFMLSGLPWNVVFYPRGNVNRKVSCVYIYRLASTHAVVAQAKFCLGKVKRTLRKNTFVGNGWGFQKFAKVYNASEYSIQLQVTTFEVIPNPQYDIWIQRLPKRNQVKAEMAQTYFGKAQRVLIPLKRELCDFSYHNLSFMVNSFECSGLEWLLHVIHDTNTNTLRVFLYSQLPKYVIEGTYSVVVEETVKTSVDTFLSFDRSHGWTDFESKFARGEIDNDSVEVWIKTRNILSVENHKERLSLDKDTRKMMYEFAAANNIGKTDTIQIKIGGRDESGMPQRKHLGRASLCGLDWKIEYYPRGKTDRKFSSVFLYREGDGYHVRAVASIWTKQSDGEVIQKNMSDAVFVGRGWGWNHFAPVCRKNEDSERTITISIQLLDAYHEDEAKEYEKRRKEEEASLVSQVKASQLGRKETREVTVLTKTGEAYGIFTSEVFLLCGLPWRLVFYLNGNDKKTSLFVHKSLKYHIVLATGDVECDGTDKILEDNIFEGTGWGWHRYTDYIDGRREWKFKMTMTVTNVLNQIEFEEFKKKELKPNEIEVKKAREKIDAREFIDINFSKKEIEKVEDKVYRYRKEFDLCNLKWNMSFRFNRGKFAFFLFLKSKAIVCDARYYIHIRNLGIVRKSSLWRYRGNTGWGFDDTCFSDEHIDFNIRLEICTKQIFTVDEDVLECKTIAEEARSIGDEWKSATFEYFTEDTNISWQGDCFYCCGIPFVTEFYPNGHENNEKVALYLYKRIVDFECRADYKLSLVDNPEIFCMLRNEKSKHPCFEFLKKDVEKYIESKKWKFKLEMKIKHLGSDIDEISVYL